MILLSFLVITNLIFSQEIDDYPNFKNSSLQEIEGNADWKILEEAEGDLNFDGKADKAIILESKDSIIEKRCEDCYKLKNKSRIILVLLNDNDKYKVVSQNNEFIARGDEGGMLNYLEPEISISNNQLKIFYQYVRSNMTYIFKHKKGSIQIESFKSVGVESASGNYGENIVDFNDNIVTIKNGHISEDPENDKIKRIHFNQEPRKLENFGTMNSWEVVSNVFL